MSVLARSDESRLRLPLEGFGVSYVGGIDLGYAAGSPRSMIKMRMFVAKAATMNHIRLSAGCILEEEDRKGQLRFLLSLNQMREFQR
jgi:hypothetical protein